MIRAIVFSLLLFLSGVLNAQEIRKSISREEALSRVVKENHSLRISEQEYKMARADYRQTNSIFLPELRASHTGISTNNPLMAFGSKLNQGIITQNDFNPDLLNDPETTQNFATQLEFNQPLINVDGIYQRRAGRLAMEAAELKLQRSSDYLVFETIRAYMQLQLAFKGVEVVEKALEAAQSNLQLAENRFKQGYLQTADILNVRVHVTEIQNQLQRAHSNVENASDYLSLLMNDDSEVIYSPADSLLVDLMPGSGFEMTEERSDIRAMQLATDSYKAMNSADKMAFLPRLNAFGSYQLYDDQIFAGNAGGYVIGAQLSWDIFQGYKRIGKEQKSRSAYEKSRLEYENYLSQARVEYKKTEREVNDSRKNMELTKLALQQSQESLRIRINRFREGLENTSDLLLAETQLAQKELEYYQTIFQFNNAVNYLQFLSKK